MLVSNYAFGGACSPRTDFNESLAFTCAAVGPRCLWHALKPGGVRRCEMPGAASSAPRRADSKAKRTQRAQRGMSEPATSLQGRKEIKGRSSQRKNGKICFKFPGNRRVHCYTSVNVRFWKQRGAAMRQPLIHTTWKASFAPKPPPS